MQVSLKEILNILKKTKRIILTTHINPDGDALGSMLGLYQYLLLLNKDVIMLLDSEISESYNFLNHINNIQNIFLEKLFADLIIVLDSSDIVRIGRVSKYIFAPILNIDHHISNTQFADYNYININASSVGEIIFDLLNLDGFHFTKNIANCLYTAIVTDCGFFRYANTNSKIMRITADLIDIGVKPEFIANALEIRSINSIIILQKALKTLKLLFHNKISVMTVAVFCDLTNNIYNTENLINFSINIKGVEIAILFKIIDDNQTQISLRSRTVDVSKIALSFGGGGHVKAAGCTVFGKFSDCKYMVIEACKKIIKEAK